LLKLVQYLNTNSFEVSKLLATLKVYQDSSKKNNTRIIQLVRAINDYRWLRAVSETQRVVLVNIPSAQLRVYEREKTLLAMKLVLGKARTPSKTFSTLIQKITINPYWVVPSSIAINEMLPKLKRDNGYIDRNHLQVLNSNYKVINAGNINWDSYDASNFPFTIRQSTGCDNSLGIIKLEFDSPFGVYLHDTPEKSLFSYNSRFYSHGCMRMEKPIEMAKLLMQKNSLALDTIDLEACAKRPDPITITVPEQMPLIVWYNLIDFDDTGAVKFYKDVYHQFTY
jgi:murein L,D-transpeptidase YcbB/YkuD